jgi:hypothetical protein
MSRRLAHCPTPRTPLTATTSQLRGWFARLAPLAVLATLGCDAGPDAIALQDEIETAGDETVGDDTASDETAADDEAGDDTVGDDTAGDESAGDESGDHEVPCDETADPVDPDLLARISAECAQRFSCDCPSDRFPDVAACVEQYMVDWAGIAAKAEAAGLTTDFECFMGAMPHASYACDSYSEYAANITPQACSVCQYAFGDRQVDETCQDFGGGVGDCADGLLCAPSADGAARCIDPCTQAGPGESCTYLACADGLVCDWNTMTCGTAGGAGEQCADGLCDDGLQCDWSTYTCEPGVGLGEACDSGPCAPGLFCGDGLVCAAPAGPGESCASAPCGDGLTCRWDDATCAAPAQAGESCLGVECTHGLFCDAALGVCAPPGSAGDPCHDRPCSDGLTCDYDKMVCVGLPALGEHCFDACADGLLCNYGVEPAVCAAWPVGGEPCVFDACAANFVCDLATQLCVDEPPMLCNL